jgi:inositol transport system substrate-binding protein
MGGRAALVLAIALAVGSCRERQAAREVKENRRLTIGVAFETLQTEYWVASFEIMKAELARQNIRMLEAIADGDANRQLEQVKSFVARRVDGIIVAPKDAYTVIPMIKAANRAAIPIVIYNRPPAPSKTRSVTIGVDNFAITKNTVERMCELAKRTSGPGGKHRALLILGDLGDINAIGRRDGFEAGVKGCADRVEVVVRVPSEWNQEKAMAGVTNGLQAHPDISFLFTSSDFLLPSIVSALKTAGKWKRHDEPGHVILGAFDGDAMAYQLLKDGYLDADGVQDAYYQSEMAVKAVLDTKAGKAVDAVVLDPGFVVHQENMSEKAEKMWGAAIARKKARVAASDEATP